MATSSDSAAAGANTAADTAPDTAADTAADKTLIFLHVPKAAGTTMASILTGQYGEQTSYHTKRQAHQQMEAMPEAQRRQLRLIHGHMPFGLHRHLSQPWTYFTMLRHPVDRVISHYYYILNSPDHSGYPVAKAARDITDYVSCGMQEQTNNVQTRHLSGIGGIVKFGQCTREHLELAKHNLERHFVLAGTSEQFDATLLLLGQRLGWTPAPYPKLNVNLKRRKRDELPRRAIATIRQFNALDLELYDYVSARLRAQIAEQGTDFQAALEAFQQANLAYGAAQDSVQVQPTESVSQRQAARANRKAAAKSELEQVKGQLAHVQRELEIAQALQGRTQHQLRRALKMLAQNRRDPLWQVLDNPLWGDRLRPIVENKLLPLMRRVQSRR
ncbi:MAG: sulfotransferase family 2 domain-containing protein [Cyanobacteria bacterium P01_A01_bin.135]